MRNERCPKDHPSSPPFSGNCARDCGLICAERPGSVNIAPVYLGLGAYSDSKPLFDPGELEKMNGGIDFLKRHVTEVGRRFSAKQEEELSKLFCQDGADKKADTEKTAAEQCAWFYFASGHVQRDLDLGCMRQVVRSHDGEHHFERYTLDLQSDEYVPTSDIFVEAGYEVEGCEPIAVRHVRAGRMPERDPDARAAEAIAEEMRAKPEGTEFLIPAPGEHRCTVPGMLVVEPWGDSFPMSRSDEDGEMRIGAESYTSLAASMHRRDTAAFAQMQSQVANIFDKLEVEAAAKWRRTHAAWPLCRLGGTINLVWHRNVEARNSVGQFVCSKCDKQP